MCALRSYGVRNTMFAEQNNRVSSCKSRRTWTCVRRSSSCRPTPTIVSSFPKQRCSLDRNGRVVPVSVSRAQLSHLVCSLSLVVHILHTARALKKLVVVWSDACKKKLKRFIPCSIAPSTAARVAHLPHTNLPPPPPLTRTKSNHGHDEQADLAFGDRGWRAGHGDGPLLRVRDSRPRVRKSLAERDRQSWCAG